MDSHGANRKVRTLLRRDGHTSDTYPVGDKVRFFTRRPISETMKSTLMRARMPVSERILLRRGRSFGLVEEGIVRACRIPDMVEFEYAVGLPSKEAAA